MGQPSTWWQVDYIGSLYLWRRQCFVIPEIDTYCGYRFGFFIHNAFTIFFVDLQNALSIIMVSHTTLLLIKELTSQQDRKRRNRPRTIEFINLTKFCNILKLLA